jgi:hypothetical protein
MGKIDAAGEAAFPAGIGSGWGIGLCTLKKICIFEQMDFIAKVEDNQRSNIQEIAQSLEKMGIKVKQILRIPGVITGSSRRMPLAQLKIKGIQSVERDRHLRAS